MDVSSDLIRSFLVVCNTGNVSLGAKILHKAQSTVSKQIAVLEEHAGIDLFDRSERPWTLTEAGRHFQNFAQEFVNKGVELDNILNEISGGVRGECRIGATTSLGTILLPRLVAKLLRREPTRKITLVVRGHEATYDAVRNAEVQFAIVFSDEPPQDLKALVLKKERFCLVTASENAMHRKPVGKAQLRRLPLVAGTDEGLTMAIANKLLAKVGLEEQKVALRVCNIEAIKRVLLAGFGNAVLPHYAVKEELSAGRLAEIPVQNARWTGQIILVERPRVLCLPSVSSVKDFLVRQIKAS